MSQEALPRPNILRAIWVSQTVRFWFLHLLALLAGVVIPLLFIGRGAASILVPLIGAMAAVVLLSSKPEQRAEIWRGGTLSWAIVAMLSIMLPSVIVSIKPGFSLAIWLQLAGLLLLTACLPVFLTERRDAFDWTLRALLVMSLIGAAIAVISIFIWPPLLGLVRPVDTPSAYHSALRLKSYGAVMPCLAPVLLWAGFRFGRAWRAVAIAAVVLGGLVVYGVDNRAALGGYAGAAGFVLIALLLRHVSLVLRFVILMPLLAAVGAVGIWVVTHLPAMPYDGSQPMRIPTWLIDSHRQVIWGFVLDRALERPWLGWGLSTANFMPGADDPVPIIGQTFVPLHPHNWVLQIFCEAGIFGLVSVAGVVLLFLRWLYRSAASGHAASWAALGLSGAFFVSSLANFAIWQGWWQSVFAILMAVALAGTRAVLRGR